MGVKDEDPVQKAIELTAGKGADFAVGMGANQAARDQAFDMMRIRGTVVTIGTFNEAVTFNPFFKMTRREMKLQSSIMRTSENWRRMNQLIDSRRVNLKPLVTHVLPLQEYQKGFELVKRSRSDEGPAETLNHESRIERRLLEGSPAPMNHVCLRYVACIRC